MNVIESNLAQLGQDSRQQDFYKIVLFRLVNKIDYHFNKDPELFYSIPQQFSKYLRKKDPSLDQTNWIYSHLKWFNSVGIDRDQLRAIFGRQKNSRARVNYKPLIEDLIDRNLITIIKHGHVEMITKDGKLERTGYPTKYLIPLETLKEVFANKSLLKTILNIFSGWYSEHQIKVILNRFLTPIENKTNDDIPKATITNTRIDQNPIEYTRSAIVRHFMAGELILEHANKLYRMFDKDRVLPTLKKSVKIVPNIKILRELVARINIFYKGRHLQLDDQDKDNLNHLNVLVAN